MRWLLNLAYMMVGKYPDGVPPRYLIPPSAFASAEDVGRFLDVAPQAGLNVFASAGGVIVDDLSGNGRFDVVTSNFYSCGPLHYFGNNGDGTFTERTAAAGLANQVGGLNIIQTDYNNDGCKDILVLRGGWEVAQRNSLLRNNCDGTFTDVTAEAGLARPATATQTAVWTDINNDGWLDLFVGNEDSPPQLFLNKGRDALRGHLARRRRRSARRSPRRSPPPTTTTTASWISTSRTTTATNILYHNNHDNTFTDTTKAAHVPGPGRGFAAWFFDYDNDGWPDLFVTSYFMSADETARTYLGVAAQRDDAEAVSEPRRRHVSRRDHRGRPRQGLHADGLELRRHRQRRVSSTSISAWARRRTRRSRRTCCCATRRATRSWTSRPRPAPANCTRVTASRSPISTTTATRTSSRRSAAPRPATATRCGCSKIPGHGNDWIAVKLVGVKSNRAAIGARIKVTVQNDGGGTRSHLPHGRKRRIVRRVAARAAHRPRQVGANRGSRDLVAGDEHASALYRRRRRTRRSRSPSSRPSTR